MKVLITVLFAIFTIGCSAQSAQRFNLDFEAARPQARLPEGWFLWGKYESALDAKVVHSGKYALKVTSDEKGMSFGSPAYKIPAYYEGKSIKLEGFMKIEQAEGGYAGLLLRIDGSGRTLAFDNMSKLKIQGTKDWQPYSITLPYPKGAEVIYVGGILGGKGKAWFDDFKLTIDGKDVQSLKEQESLVFKADQDGEFDAGSKINLTGLDERSVQDLVLLGKIWGFLKYHHPEIGKGSYNWDYELFRMLPAYLKNKDHADRDQILLQWIGRYGNIPDCKSCQQTDANALLKPDHAWIETGEMSTQLKERLKHIYQNRHQGKHYYIGMAPGVGNPQFLHENNYADMPYPDAGFRLLALYKYWNMIHYFFPNKHLTDKDWNLVLKEYIPVFIKAENELAYEMAAVRIIGEVKDTHANLWGGSDKFNEWKGSFYPPVRVQFIEGKLVVTDYYNAEHKKEAGLQVGDMITHINGKKVEDMVESVKQYYPASNKAAQMRDISVDLLRSDKEAVHINYVSGSKARQKVLKLYEKRSLSYYTWYRNDDNISYRLLDGNIGYVTLKSIQKGDEEVIKETFKDANGIIIDIRNYPGTFVPFSLGSYFVSSASPFVKFTKGNANNPGEFTFTKAIEIPKAPKTYKGKLVVIVNEITQSQAEYTAMAFRAGANTTLIGSTTAGADGNVSTILLPGGLRTMISGIGVYYPNGTETQRIGIVPDMEVKPTIEGIRKGKDELLEKAIEIINNQNGQSTGRNE